MAPFGFAHETPRSPPRFGRRTFLAGAGSLASVAILTRFGLAAATDELARRGKSIILLWMGGGPSTIDLWDMKPDAETGGPFRPIGTSGEMQICEHLPQLAQQMHRLAVVRSMSTREADHHRARYYLHTGYSPNPLVKHPSLGAVVARETLGERPKLELPPFIVLGGGSVGAGLLGSACEPLTVVKPQQFLTKLAAIDKKRLASRLKMLRALEEASAAEDVNGSHGKSSGTGALSNRRLAEMRRTVRLVASKQVKAFDLKHVPPSVLKQYGNNDFGRQCLIARRLVEVGVPLVEVVFPGWDDHEQIFPALRKRLPVLDQAFRSLVDDLAHRDRLKDTVVCCLGEFGRSPQINAKRGRDHWARAWSVVLGGGNVRGGLAVGETDRTGQRVVSQPQSAENLLATLLTAADISPGEPYTTPSGVKLAAAGGGQPIAEVLDRPSAAETPS